MEDFATFIGKPTINYGQPNKAGVRAEVKITSGYAWVDKIETKKQRNKNKQSDNNQQNPVKVLFIADNIKWNVGGWTKTGSDVYSIIEKAYNDDVPVFFRIETFRKKDIPADVPILELTKTMEIAKESVIHNLSAVKLEQDDDWTISNQILTRIEEDIDPYNNDRVNNVYEIAPINNTMPVGDMVEAPPYKVWNDNGSLNLGSNAMLAVCGLYGFVNEACLKENLELSQSKIGEITSDLFNVCNNIQKTLYKVQKIDFTDPSSASHTRIRGLVKQYLDTYPLSLSIVDSEDDYQKYLHALEKWIVGIMKFAAKTVTVFYRKQE